MTTITLVNEQNSTGNPFSAHMLCEQRAIQEITYELLQSQQHVSNKDIIAKLIEKLETEKDVVQLDIYRNALEAVLFQTPDDGNDSNLLIVFYVQIMPDDFVMQLHRF